MVNRIFESIQPNFFRILSNASKFEYAECLALLYESLSESNEYTMLRHDAVLILQNYFEQIRLKSYETLVQTSRDRANNYLREMKETGWIEEDIGANYQQMLSLSETAVQFLIFIDTLKYDTELKYSSQIYAIYRSFKPFDLEKGELVLEEAYKNTVSFFDSLRRLNTSIKKYIQKIFDESITNDLSELFQLLTGEYQLKIVDAAYYHLLTKDNPSQYTFTITDSIERILSDYDAMHEMSLRNAVDNESYERNYQDLQLKLTYMLEKFLNIQTLIHEINKKNQAFVTSAIGRIYFLMNESTDITGSINELIKNMALYPDFEVEGLLSDVSILDDASLASPRKRTLKESSYIEEMDETQRDIRGIQDKLVKLSKYSKQQVDRIVLELLKGKQWIHVKEYATLDVTMVTLIFLYGYAYDASYTIEQTPETYINQEGKVLGNYIIRRRPV